MKRVVVATAMHATDCLVEETSPDPYGPMRSKFKAIGLAS